jgi:flagellar biosynthesis protein FliR
MGLGFATLVDPQHGANVTVVGQLIMIMGMLTYLAINGHLMLLGALANSFQTLPIGSAGMDRDFLLSAATWGGRIFETGLMVALPAVIALVIVNLALGVVTRAAPQLNLFGIGFTISILCGFFVLIVGLDGIMTGISNLIDSALMAVVDLVGGSPPGASAAGAH